MCRRGSQGCIPLVEVGLARTQHNNIKAVDDAMTATHRAMDKNQMNLPITHDITPYIATYIDMYSKDIHTHIGLKFSKGRQK